MADRPEQLPEWATEDQIDDVSGQNNVVEPPSERKGSGWDRREIPPRQWQNWLARLYYRWIDYIVSILDDATNEETPDTIAKRDAAGRMRAEDPEAAQDVVTKNWYENEASTLMPLYPEVLQSDGELAISSSNGGVVLESGGEIVFRGQKKITTSEETFNTDADKVYHLRIDIDGNVTLNDLSDTEYNPDALDEDDSEFDTDYDDMLIALVETGSSNDVSVTTLKNKAFLRWHDEMEWFNISDAGTNSMKADAESVYNFSRTPENYDYFLTKMDYNDESASAFDLDWYQHEKEVTRYKFYIRFGIDYATDGTFEFNASC